MGVALPEHLARFLVEQQYGAKDETTSFQIQKIDRQFTLDCETIAARWTACHLFPIRKRS
jgi:hypothetical protein